MPNEEIHPTNRSVRHGFEVWAERHRLEGHRPHPAPTDENPERWDCDCGGVNRILTGEQIRMKFAHLTAAAKARREGRPLPWDDPAWQKEIRDAKQAVADAAARQLRFDDDDDRP